MAYLDHRSRSQVELKDHLRRASPGLDNNPPSLACDRQGVPVAGLAPTPGPAAYPAVPPRTRSHQRWSLAHVDRQEPAVQELICARDATGQGETGETRMT
jgi:hypothetical protein